MNDMNLIMPTQIADVLILRGDQLLLVQQKKKVAYGLWSYPGGRVEANESLEQAIIREAQEELGLELIDPKPFKIYRIETTEGSLEINSFTGDIRGDIKLKTDELLAYRWFTLDDLRVSKSELRGEVVFQQAVDAFERRKLSQVR